MRLTSKLTSNLAALLVAASMLVGCGYALVGKTSSLPEDIQEIYVEALVNQTRRAQLEQVLSRAIADEFVKRRRFVMVSSAAEADAVLGGTVTSFSARPVSFAGTEGRAREFEIVIGAKMRFTRTDNDEVLWKQDAYQFRELYEADISAEEFFSREDQAIEEVAVKFAETLIIDVLEGF